MEVKVSPPHKNIINQMNPFHNPIAPYFFKFILKSSIYAQVFSESFYTY